jgi:recombinational DNA repair ATPase RecF
MITAIEAVNYRGIQQGRLEGLTPLTVLVGPNGCGKSAMLDVAYVAASRSFVDALALTIRRRHSALKSSARWIVNAVAWQQATHTCRFLAVLRKHEVVVELSHQPPFPGFDNAR